MSKHHEQIIAAAKGKLDEETIGAAWGKPHGASTAGGGADMKELVDVFERAKATV